MALVPDRSPNRVDASLVYDTRSDLGTPGVRTAIQRARRLLYAADNTELIIQVAPERQSTNVRLFGQVLDDGLPVSDATVSLVGAADVVQCPTDEDGEFRIADLPKGSYGLDIHAGARLIGITGMDLD